MKKGYIYIILAAVIFSTMEIASKLVVADFNPFQLIFIRFIIGGFFLLPFALKGLKTKNIRLGWKDAGYFLLIGTLCVVISMSFFQLAIVYTKASTVAILFSVNPIFTIPLAAIYLKEKITKSTIASLVLSVAGMIVILSPFNLGHDFKGIILAIMASLTFALYNVASKAKSGYYGSMIINSFTFLAGDLILLILIFLSNLKGVAGFLSANNLEAFSGVPIFQGINSGNILILIYLGIVVTGLGYLTYFKAMNATNASTASLVFLIKPALAPILALLVLGESIPVNTMVGIGLIVLGSSLTFMKAMPFLSRK
ncbi:MAG: DMT family transporter [Clostridiaceae bacterium]